MKPKVGRPYAGETAEQRWRRSYVVESSGCWRWEGRANASGYGTLRVNGITTLAHRFGFELLVGPIPEGKQIDHLCRNRVCVNPQHLEPVDGRTNWDRGISPPRLNVDKTACINGHPLSGTNLLPTRPGRQCRECNRANAARWRARMKAAGAPKDRRGRLRALSSMRGEEYAPLAQT